MADKPAPPKDSPQVVQLQRKMKQIDQHYKAEIAFRDVQITELQDRMTMMEGSILQLVHEIQELRLTSTFDKPQRRSARPSVSMSHQRDQSTASIATVDFGAQHQGQYGERASPVAPQQYEYSQKPLMDPSIVAHGNVVASSSSAAVTLDTWVSRPFQANSLPNFCRHPPLWALLGIAPPTTHCGHALPAGVIIPREYGSPEYKFELPPFPFEKRLSNLYKTAADPEAIGVHEFFSDERNWPAWTTEWLRCHESETPAEQQPPLVTDHRLIVSMLVLQDSWKRMHAFPLGHPNIITCSGVCTAECGVIDDFAGFPTLWGWPCWEQVRKWEIEELKEQTKKLRTPLPAKVPESQEYRAQKDKNTEWLKSCAAKEGSFKLEVPIPGCKYRGGSFWATMDDIKREIEVSGVEVKYSMYHA